MDNSTKLSNQWELSIVKEAMDCGILNSDSVLDIIRSSKKEQIKKMHAYAITPPSKDGGRWQTWYKGTDGKKKNIKAQTEEELLDKLVPLYFQNSYIDKLTFHKLYEEWLE